MRPIRLGTLAAAAILTIGAAPAPRGNWLTTIAVSPAGGHQLGNPAAPVKVVEFISYTCPHCAHFQREADGPLKLLYIQPGKVQVEVRHLVRDQIDLTVAMLTNCGAPNRFFVKHNLFLRSQDKWVAQMDRTSAAQKARWSSGDYSARLRAIAGDLGFYAIMGQVGYDRPVVDRCLSGKAMQRRLADQTAEAQRLGVTGTPSFMLNGVLLADTHSWDALKGQIDARF